MRRAWIEIGIRQRWPSAQRVALREEGVDRNNSIALMLAFIAASPSVRRAWIEIVTYTYNEEHHPVALREEGVDRNIELHPLPLFARVALREEGVDRNVHSPDSSPATLGRPP